jgi:hypothetical protein
MHPYSTKSHYVKYAGSFTSDYAMNTVSSCISLFSTVITNHFIGEGFYLSQHSMNGYEAMGFDVTQLTQDMEQSLFTIKTIMPIPMLVYGDAFLPVGKIWSSHSTIESRFDKP